MAPSTDTENSAMGMTCPPSRSRPPMVGGAATSEESATASS